MLEELGGADGPRWPSVVSRRQPPGLLDPVFALQQLPRARLVRGPTAEALADAAAVLVAAELGGASGPFGVHTFVPSAGPYRSVVGQVGRTEVAFLKALRQRLGGAMNRYRKNLGATPEEFGVASLVQLVLVGKTVLLVSVATPHPLPGGGFDLSPWPAGRAPVAEDKEAPSRAYRKLVEGFAWMGARPGAGETVVDLGGAPGGWAWTALKAGARVTAVDRSPLAPPALDHPALTMVIGNAFTHQPPEPVDWLLCDVICEPQRSIDLADRWMGAGWCRSLCTTIKFKGPGQYSVLPAARERLARHGWRFLRLKHMDHHHNEAVILARK